MSHTNAAAGALHPGKFAGGPENHGAALHRPLLRMGHRDFKTTLIYADYAPSEHEAAMAERAFTAGTNPGTKLSETEMTSGAPSVPEDPESELAEPAP